MVFGVDGASTEILELHRVNVNFDRVLRNMKEYMSECTSEHTEWQYIMFDENKTDLLPAVKIAKELGIKTFYIRHPNGFADQESIPVYNFFGKFTHWLTPVTEEYKPWLDQHWNLTQDHTYNNLVSALEKVIPIYEEKCHTSDVPSKYTPNEPMSYDGMTLYDVELLPHMIEQIKQIDTQECYSLNFHKHTDLQNEVLSIFVSHDNYVYPCCVHLWTSFPVIFNL